MARQPDYSFFIRRLDRRVGDIWNLAADDPDRALARAIAFRHWLDLHPMTGEHELARKVFLGQLSELIRLLTR
ncbi:MAG TPA: hypothetical protein VFW75_12175 [Acetobacteraceae bacterium]|nr:hypothetical protein [Acetobacteraceae bacterium]